MLREVMSSRVAVPGLDERLEDLPLLIDHFAREVGKRPDDLSTAARALLARRAYPGQVAELRSAIRAAAGRAGAGLIQPEHFERAQVATSAGPSGEDPLVLGFREATRTFQKDLVQRALEATTGHLGRAADLLAIPKAQLQKLAKDLDVGLGEES
jgi:DNA-binding NtrC family response regulator